MAVIRTRPQTDLPVTGFNNTRFWIVLDEGSTSVDWERGWVTNVRHVPGSGTTVVQALGATAPALTLRIECDGMADLVTLIGLVQTQGTLTLPWGLFSGGTYDRVADEEVVRYYNAALVGISNRTVYLDGSVQADASFLLPDVYTTVGG